MRKIDKFKKRINNYLYNHYLLKNTLSLCESVLICSISACIYAFAVVAFINPAIVNQQTIINDFASSPIITGGVNGISQIIYLIIEMSGGGWEMNTIISIFYFSINVPLILFAFFKVGKRFSFLTLLNVTLSSVLINFAFKDASFIQSVALKISDQQIARVLFGGAMVGLSSAICYKIDGSCGGIDIISYYFAMRKSTNVGKYTGAVNIVIVIAFTLLSLFDGINKGLSNQEVVVLNIFFSILYTFVTVLVIDVINVRNKKAQIQIISENLEISPILISNFPHSTTIVDAKGGYSHKDKNIVYIVVSSNEIKKVINLVRKVDPQSFICVTALNQAYGNFYIKPVD